MKHTRHGFTMIELIFVIVIIGILAGVALPRFVGVSEDAHLSKVKAFVGTLNRTVAPSMWSSMLNNDGNGSVKTASLKRYNSIYSPDSNGSDGYAQVETIPAELGNGISLDLTKCQDSNTTVTATLQGITSFTLGEITYKIICKDGSTVTSPHFYLSNGSKIIAK